MNSYLEMLGDTGLPWMVGVLQGDVVATGVAEAAIRAGGHVRVGLEFYAGPGRPSNEELVAQTVDLGLQLGRAPADVDEVVEILWG